MQHLQSYNVDPGRITVSGISAGGFMATQLHVAFSDVFSGAGVIAGGPFLVAENSLHLALARAMRAESPIDVGRLAGMIRQLEAAGAIAPTSNLEKHKVWAFWGRNDTTVQRPAMDALNVLYQRYVLPENIRYVDDINAPHAMVTDKYGVKSATQQESPHMNNCGYDAAGQLLSHLYGPLKERTRDARQVTWFDQTEFLSGTRWHSIADAGMVYIPTGALEGRRCGVHVALHGCGMQQERIGMQYVEHAGYNEWAEANDIIVLYPQTRAIVSFLVFNPKGAWDWWGYSDNRYFTRSGRQMRMIVKMVNRLTGNLLAV